MSKATRAGKPVDLPIYGDAEHNINVYHAIGALVINWANDESWFRGMLTPFFDGDRHSAAIAWFSHNSSANRIALVLRLCRQHIKDRALLSEIEKVHTEFSGCSKIRNFFCHGTYSYADDGKLASVENVTLSQEGKPLRPETRALDKQTLNSVVETARRLADLNELLSELPNKIGDILKAQRSKP
jgi:hypothetical protein